MDQAASVIELTSANLSSYCSEEQISVLDFWAPWCVPCRRMSKIFEEVSNELGKDSLRAVRFFKVNVDAEPSLADRFGVTNLPTVIALSGQRPISRFMGNSKEDMVRWIQSLLNSN